MRPCRQQPTRLPHPWDSSGKNTGVGCHFLPPPRVMEIKTKVNKWDLIKRKKLLHSKGNYKQGEKTTLGMGENNSK